MILKARGLAIGYRGRPVGENLDLGLAPGRVLALLGPNGGGKTTVLKTLIGLLPPLAGAVLVEGGRSRSSPPPSERARRIACVPQVHQGTFAFTVAQVVLMGRTAHHGPFARPASEEAATARALERLGIAHLGSRSYTMISGGERQLGLVARALAQEPRIVVLDEPAVSLDFGNQGRVLRELRALADSGLAVLFTTHDPNGALHHADDRLLIRDGRLVGRDPAGETPTTASLEALYGAGIQEVGAGARRAFLPV